VILIDLYLKLSIYGFTTTRSGFTNLSPDQM
jgi:hypothetical protein